jgi:thiamine biosynthesis lipoprotein
MHGACSTIALHGGGAEGVRAEQGGAMQTDSKLEERGRGVHALCFAAMGSPCEVLVHGVDAPTARELGQLAADEAWRIERKFSRYRDDSVIAEIHRRRGHEQTVDEETAGLIEFAYECYELSDGYFDITSGVLRRAWKFDGSDRVPAPEQIEALRPLIGFHRLRWRTPTLVLPEGMELDLGGIGKEYAVDCAFALVAARTRSPFLVNFGGDLRASAAMPHGPWQVAVERPGEAGAAAMVLELERGALATSGDARRFLLKDGVRYSHVLDPHTGWPVRDAPRSVTVAAANCTEAGLLATISLLNGLHAEAFLAEQGVKHWIVR